MTTGGRLIVEGLVAQGVDRLFCVPGESYLAVLDALVDSPIRAVLARQEGGAAMMAEADGKLTGRPGICFVTRGPGATNAAAGVHVAQQDSTPMILFVGQIGRQMRGRDAFQEVNYHRFFGSMAKWVEEIDDAARIPEILSHAFHVAMSGRPGPVVLALPEDMLSGPAPALAPAPRVEVAAPAPSAATMARLAERLAAAERPVLIAGGSRWTPADCDALAEFATRCDLPVACSFRRQMLLDNTHPNYAGDIGLGANPALVARIRDSDLILLLGPRLSENPSQGFSLLDIPGDGSRIVHVHPGPEELGRIYAPALAINATPGEFLAAARGMARAGTGAAAAAHAAQKAWSDTPPETEGPVQMGAVVSTLNAEMPGAAITNGAGNFATWAHRFFRYRGFGSQVAPTSGSMGYGLPAGIAAALRQPGRETVVIAGDGDLQMTMQEFGTACQEGAGLIVIVVDNGIYGTIRMHQERAYPGRVSATTLRNPDFAAIARAYGAHAERVGTTGDFAPALARARAAVAETGGPALLHLVVSPEAITPNRSLTQIREGR